MSLQWKFTVFTPQDLLGVEVDHLQGTVEISIHEFTPFGSRTMPRDHIPLCASCS